MNRFNYPYRKSDIKKVNKFIETYIKFILWMISAFTHCIAGLSNSHPSTNAEQKKLLSNVPIENRRWLVLANEDKCDYNKAFSEDRYVEIYPKNRKLRIGDTVYLFMLKERRVRYETMVVKVGETRKDWTVSTDKEPICKLEFITEHKGKQLKEAQLKKHGFKGDKTIRLPICNNLELLDFIEEQFDEINYSV